jgi:hypothetical protein
MPATRDRIPTRSSRRLLWSRGPSFPEQLQTTQGSSRSRISDIALHRRVCRHCAATWNPLPQQGLDEAIADRHTAVKRSEPGMHSRDLRIPLLVNLSDGTHHGRESRVIGILSQSSLLIHESDWNVETAWTMRKEDMHAWVSLHPSTQLSAQAFRVMRRFDTPSMGVDN